MKKLIFILLLFTGYLNAQTLQNPTYGNTTTNTLKIKTPATVTSVNFLPAFDADGITISKINPVNLPPSLTSTENSAGAIQGFSITNNGDGTINVATGTAYLRATNDQYAPLLKFTIPAVTNLALTDNANNFVLVDYNGGSPAITVTTNGASINTETNSIAAVVSRVGTTLDFISLVGQNNDANAKLRVRFLNQEGIRRASGAIIGFSNRNLTLTSGTLFSGLIRINSPVFNTASPDTFTYVYNNGAVWTRVTGQTQVNNTQYNNAGVLTTMPNNDYRTDYVYLLPNNPSKLYVVYGTATYNSVTLARNAPVPSSLPSELQVLGLLVGRQIIQKNAVAITEVSSAFADVFTGTGVPEHNSLAGLQGGAVNDYQHLTTSQLNDLVNIGSGTINYIPYFIGAKTFANSMLFQTANNVQIGTQNTTFGVGYSVSKLLTVINKHSFEDYSLINTVSGNEGFGVFDASTEMTGSNSNDHLNGYQSRLNYSASVGMTGPNYNIYGMTGYLAQNRVTGTGHLTVAKGFFARDLGGAVGTVDNLYGLHIDPQTKGSVTNWDIHATGKNNHFGAVMIGAVPAQWNGTDALVNTGISNFSGLAKFTSQVRISSPSNTVPALQIGDYINNFGWGIFESNTTGNLFVNSKNSGVVITGFELQRSTGNMGLGGSPNTDKLRVIGNASGSVAASNSDHFERKGEHDSDLALKANVASPTFTGTPNAPTASPGTNNTQVATTAYVDVAISTASANYVNLTTTQTITGQKNFSSSTSGVSAIGVTTSGSSNGQTINNVGTGTGLVGINTSSGIFAAINSQTGSTGDIFQFQKNSVTTSRIDQNGNYIKVGGTNGQILLADGTTAVRPKVYTALISQTSTSAPTVTVLGDNTIGTIVWTRTTTGSYVGTLSGAFTASKTICFINNTVVGSNTIQQASANTVTLTTADSTGTLLDGRLTANSLRIEVYP